MAKFFNTAGPCDPDRHYMLPPERRLPEVRKLIDQAQKPGLPFINIAGRLFGLADLQKMESDALKWLNSSSKAFASHGLTFKTAPGIYFGNLFTAVATLQSQPLAPKK